MVAEPERRHLQQDVSRLQAARALDRYAAPAPRQRRKLCGEDFAEAALAPTSPSETAASSARSTSSAGTVMTGAGSTPPRSSSCAPTRSSAPSDGCLRGASAGTGRAAALAPLWALLFRRSPLPLLDARRNSHSASRVAIRTLARRIGAREK